MWRKLLIALLNIVIFTSFTIQVDATTFPNRPPFPMENVNELVHKIIITDNENISSLLNLIEEKYPSIKINHIYKHVFTGFSVKGTRKDLQQFETEEGIHQSSYVTAYKVSLDKSIPFIGGDAIRGHFDTLDHRITGKGIKVGIIDTGVDYTHPDLHMNYRGGYDLVDGDDDPMETKGTTALNTVHGTHVAGIIAANGKIKGVAPEAEIIGYRALGPGGMGTSEQVIAAVDRAIEDKVDIINLSLGNTVNGPDWPTSLALDKATEKGIVAVTSSGNSGPNVWTVGSPGTSSKAISVGASTPPIKVPYLKVGLEDRNIELTLLQGSKRWDFLKQREIVVAGIGDEENILDVSGKVVLLERGKITFTEKAQRAQKAGAVAVLIYNNEEGNFEGGLESELPIPVASISQADGKWLIKQIKKGNHFITTAFKVEKDTIAQFSSRGPVTSTWDIKPDIVAPGVAIESTIPNGYLELQGTSMSAPHVAGASALLKQAHPDWSPVQIKAAIMNTALLLKNKQNSYYKPYEQGAGRIQLHEAIHAETLVYPSSLAFGMLHNKDPRTEKKIKITVENVTEATKYYSFANPKQIDGIQWKTPLPFYLKSNEKKEVELSIDVTPSIIGAGLHHGYLFLKDDNREIQIPYMYVIEEPNYPRIMGFQIGRDQKKGTIRYEVYLPGGAEEFGIALYDPDTFRFINYLDWKRDVTRGLIKRDIYPKKLKLEGTYKALVFAKRAGREDTLEVDIDLSQTTIGSK